MTLGRDWSRPLGASGSRGWGEGRSPGVCGITWGWELEPDAGLNARHHCWTVSSGTPCSLEVLERGQGAEQRPTKQRQTIFADLEKTHWRERCSVLASFLSHWSAILEPKVMPQKGGDS